MKISAAQKLLTLIFTLILLTSCSGNVERENPGSTDGENNGGFIGNLLSGFTAGASDNEGDEFYPKAEYSEFDLNTEISSGAVYIEFDGTNVKTDSSVERGEGYIAISGGGDYVLSGNYSGMIVVSSSENVHLILNGLTLEADMSPINIKSAKNVCITLADGTVNAVSDTSNYTFSDGNDEPSAAVYSKADLTINGGGALEVNGNYDKGIHSKDDLKIVSGTISVKSVGDAVKGKDCVLIRGGEITIESNADGVKSNNDADEEKGYVIIDGGKLNISVGDDGIHAESWLIVNGGEINIEKSYEGIEGKRVEIYGGDINIMASDDGINAASGSSSEGDFEKNIDNFNSMPRDRGSDWSVPTDGDSFHERGFADREDSDIGIPEKNFDNPEMSFDGDGNSDMNIPGEDFTVPQDAEGFSRGEKNKNFGGDKGTRDNFGGKNGGGSEVAEEGVYIRICGGNIFVEAGVDSIDSNGTLEISGGNITLSGTSMAVWGSPDCMLDTNGETVVSGGTFIAYARSASSVENAVSLPSITLMDVKNSEDVTITNSKGEAILSIDNVPSCGVLYIASDKLTSGERYSVSAGGSVTEVVCK